MITLLDRAIANVLRYGPHTVTDISYELWLQTGVDISEDTVRRCLYRMVAAGPFVQSDATGKAVVWSLSGHQGGNNARRSEPAQLSGSVDLPELRAG